MSARSTATVAQSVDAEIKADPFGYARKIGSFGLWSLEIDSFGSRVDAFSARIDAALAKLEASNV